MSVFILDLSIDGKYAAKDAAKTPAHAGVLPKANNNNEKNPIGIKMLKNNSFEFNFKFVFRFEKLISVRENKDIREQ